jgi:uncharacterized protein YaaN involved in tellurite resistance
MENEKIFNLMEKMYADLKGGQEKLYTELKGSQDKMYTELKDSINNLEKIVLRIEQDHGQKLEALFDGYKQISENLDRVEQEVSKHEEVILRKVK